MARSVATVWSTRALARKARRLRERIRAVIRPVGRAGRRVHRSPLRRQSRRRRPRRRGALRGRRCRRSPREMRVAGTAFVSASPRPDADYAPAQVHADARGRVLGPHHARRRAHPARRRAARAASTSSSRPRGPAARGDRGARTTPRHLARAARCPRCPPYAGPLADVLAALGLGRVRPGATGRAPPPRPTPTCCSPSRDLATLHGLASRPRPSGRDRHRPRAARVLPRLAGDGRDRARRCTPASSRRSSASRRTS